MAQLLDHSFSILILVLQRLLIKLLFYHLKQISSDLKSRADLEKLRGTIASSRLDYAVARVLTTSKNTENITCILQYSEIFRRQSSIDDCREFVDHFEALYTVLFLFFFVTAIYLESTLPRGKKKEERTPAGLNLDERINHLKLQLCMSYK